MKKIFQKFSPNFLTAIILLSAPGCVPLVIGAAAGVGGFAWVQGELVNDLQVPAERLHKAVSRAMRDLRLAVMEDKGDRLSAKVLAKYSDGTDVTISIAAKTEKVSTLKIRVGILGDKEKSELILNAIQKRL